MWFNCCAGVAGDMLLAALVDAGADVDAIADGLAGLGVDGYALAFERVQRCGVGATWANVAVHDNGHHAARRTTPHVAHAPSGRRRARVDRRRRPPRPRPRPGTGGLRTLADVEGEIHGVAAEDVELHEVGALDSIIDVVGVCVALEVLGVDTIVCSPIAVGHGTVRTAHGELPNPVPAVTALLASAGAPTVGIDTTMETATPTGVALMTVLAERLRRGPVDDRHGPPASARAPPTHRVDPTSSRSSSAMPTADSMLADAGRPARLVEANVDDVTGEVLAHTIASLLAAGAYDAWATPIVMKKGRPAHTVHALCDDATLVRCQPCHDRRDRHPRRPGDDRRTLAAAARAT